MEPKNLQPIISVTGYKANIIAMTAAMEEIRIAYADDTNELGLYYDGNWYWVGSLLDLDDLNDVTITSPVTGQLLQFNGTIWVNADPPAPSHEVLLDDNSDPLQDDNLDWIYEG